MTSHFSDDADLGRVFDVAAKLAAEANAPTNLDRATRYEILGVVERLRSWQGTRDPRMLAECDARIRRLTRDVRFDQASAVDELASLVRRAGTGPSDAVTPEVASTSQPPLSDFPEVEVESMDLLISALAGLRRGLRRWPFGGESRGLLWKIDDEQAVQRLVWLALAPTFRQMRSEEPVGGTGPPRWRPDFVFPRLGLALEVKYVRTASRWPGIFGEIAEDDGRCRSEGSPFRTLALVIWDHSRSTEQHDEWEEVVLRLASVRAVTVIPRPGAL
jgi:hypothetical protein